MRLREIEGRQRASADQTSKGPGKLRVRIPLRLRATKLPRRNLALCRRVEESNDRSLSARGRVPKAEASAILAHWPETPGAYPRDPRPCRAAKDRYMGGSFDSTALETPANRPWSTL